MKFDKPFLAIGLGNIALIPIEIFTLLMKHYNFTTVSALEAMSMLWLPEGSWLLGILSGVGIGSWISLAIYYSAKIWGTDYFLIKSMLIAMTAESLIFITFGVLGRNLKLVQNVSGNYIHAFAAAFGGFLAGFLIKKYLLIKMPISTH